MRRICAAALMLFLMAGCTQSTDTGATTAPESETTSAAVPALDNSGAKADRSEPAETEPADTEPVATETIVMCIPGMH